MHLSLYLLFIIYYSLICDKRSDKRKDRVEIEPAQLTAAAAEAEVPLASYYLHRARVRVCAATLRSLARARDSTTSFCRVTDTGVRTLRCLQQRLSVQLGKQIRVVGWYHSHPHITVHPSHVGTHPRSALARF